MTDEKTPRRSNTWSPRVVLTTVAVAVLAFGAGYGWQWLEANEARERADALQLDLTFEELENRLASAVIQVENDAFEGGRELMSRFFTGLQSNVDRARAGARPELERILARRDAVITALSRADPASRELLSRIYTRYQVAMGGPEVGIPIPAPMPADTVPAVDTTGPTGPAGEPAEPAEPTDTSGGGDGGSG